MQGFYLTYDRTSEALGVRGVGRPSDYNNRVLLLQDGIRRNDIFGEAPVGDGFLFSMDMVDRIEIVRGPGSSLYGSSAMLAVVNVITRKGAGVGGTILEAGIADFGERQASVLHGSTLGGDTDLMVHGVWNDADGADLFFPEFAATDSEGFANGRNWSRHVGATMRVTRGDLSVSARGGRYETGDPTAPFLSAFDSESFRNKSVGGVDATWARSLTSRTHLMVSGYGWSSEIDSEYFFDDPLPSVQANVSGTVWGVDTHMRFDPVPEDRLILGARYVGPTRPSSRAGSTFPTRSPASRKPCSRPSCRTNGRSHLGSPW